MEMKIKQGAEASTSDFWYDLTSGGYLKPSELLEDPEVAKKVEEAVKLVQEFEEACREQIEGFDM